MWGLGFTIGHLRGKAMIGVLGLVLLMRVLVPAGWMPMADSGFAITLCSGMDGAVSAWVDKDGNIHKGEPAGSKADHPCAFAGLANALDLPSFAAVALVSTVASSAWIAARPFAVDIGRGLAAPPPPPTGPPATL